MNPHFRILVVDDNQSAADSLQKLLTLRGHEVYAGYTGQDAVDKAPELSPDIIMLDIGLPDMTGYEAAQKIREDLGYLGTLIALTGYGQDTDKETAHKAGFDYHLTKPAGLAEIEEVFERIGK